MPPATYWLPNDRQKGYVTSTTETGHLKTEAGDIIDTQASDRLIESPNIVIPIEATQWSETEV